MQKTLEGGNAPRTEGVRSDFQVISSSHTDIIEGTMFKTFQGQSSREVKGGSLVPSRSVSSHSRNIGLTF